MNRLSVAVIAGLVGGVLALVAAPPAEASISSTCVAPEAVESTVHASMTGMSDMAEMDPGSAVHPMSELTDELARTPAGGTLTVQPGVYRGTLVIDSPVTIVGIGHPVLRGDGTGSVVVVRAAGSTVRDLMIENSGPGPVDNPAGVRVEADGVVVQGLHIRDTYTGIWVDGAADAHILDNVIEGRDTVAVSGQTPTVMDGDMAGMAMGTRDGGAQNGRGDGVSLFNAVRPVVASNSLSHVRDGVYLSYGAETRIECNTVVNGRYAVHSMYGANVRIAGNQFRGNQSGPVMMYGGPVTLEANVIREQQSAATGFGVLLLDVEQAQLVRNIIIDNRVGVQVDGPTGGPEPTAIELNTIALNQVGVGLYPTADAQLSQNSFVENTVQVLGLGPDGGGGASIWNRAGVGNYWSDYRGFSRSGHGVGEIPHIEGAAAGRLLASNPTLLALASSPSFTLLRAVEQRSVGQQPLVVDQYPLLDPRSPALPPTAAHASLGLGLVSAAGLGVCLLFLVRSSRRRPFQFGRKRA